MVCTIQVVVYGLGNPDDPAFIAAGLHVFADFVAGIHGIVAADIEEVADIPLFENFQQSFIIRSIHFRILELISTGTQSTGRRMGQQSQLLRIFQVQIIKPVFQNAFNAVGCAKDSRDLRVSHSCFDNAVSAGINDRSRAAGLPQQAGAFQFTHSM